MVDRPEMFGPSRGFSGMADSVEPCIAKCCGPTLVATATKFGLGAEIQSPTGLPSFFCLWSGRLILQRVIYYGRNFATAGARISRCDMATMRRRRHLVNSQ